MEEERGIHKGLTRRQSQILNFIMSELRRKGYPPSVREIGEAVGLSSSSTVHSHLAALEAKGYVRRDPTKPRALEVMNWRDTETPVSPEEVRVVHLVGRIAAGEPILAEQNIEDTLPLPASLVDDNSFLLRVKGDSMIEAGILDGDLLVIRQQSAADNGDIVAALVGEEATVKRFFREANHIRLQPENSSMEPILTQDAVILGKAIALIRSL